MDPNLLADLFTVSFWFGAAATILSFVFGLGRHGPSHTHVVHTGDVTAHHASADIKGQADFQVSPLNLNSILAFLVAFGAVGLLLPSGVGAVIALLLAALAGLFAGWLVFLFITRFLVRGQTYLRDEPMVGTLGRISIPISPAHLGEIIYTRNGVRRSDGARSADGQGIEEGEEVVIIGYTNGIATVERWREYFR